MNKATAAKRREYVSLKIAIKHNSEVIKYVKLSGVLRGMTLYLDKHICRHAIVNSIAPISATASVKLTSGRKMITGAYIMKNGSKKAVNPALMASHAVGQYRAPAIWEATRAPIATGGVMWEKTAKTKQKK